jgi:hypothetical protein
MIITYQVETERRGDATCWVIIANRLDGTSFIAAEGANSTDEAAVDQITKTLRSLGVAA